MRGFEGWRFDEHLEMAEADPEVYNSWEHPDAIVPRKNGETKVEKEILTAVLKPQSWNVLRFKK